MRFGKTLLLVLAGLVPAVASAQVTFHGVGVSTFTSSAVRDATKVGSVIYAVGGAGTNAGMWSIDGNTAAILTLLPNFGTGTAATTAGAITPDAAFIASQARTGPTAVRVARSLLPGVSANLNLNASPYTVFGVSTVARALSTNGSILYGMVNGSVQAARFDTNSGTSTLIPLLNTTTVPVDVGSTIPIRGTSSDGSVAVGTSVILGYGGTTGGRAFRYVQGVGVSGIPLLAGGTWNKSIAVSPDGNLTMVAGNSTFIPNGEVSLYNATTFTSTSLGSPNTAWIPFQAAGGMTSDGSVVVVTYSNAALNHHYVYFHNSHGWFHLASAMVDGGVDLVGTGWEMENGAIFGVSYDGTLVYGQGQHNGVPEGFVAEFPAGFLAAYSSPPKAPTNYSIVGAWNFPDSNNNPTIAAFLADGTYYLIEGNTPLNDPEGPNGGGGFERGLYYWNSQTGALSVVTVQSSMGDHGLSGANGEGEIPLTISGDNILFGTPDDGDTGTRVSGSPSSLVGAWLLGNASVDNSSQVVIFLNDGSYYLAQDGDSTVDPSGQDGIERGTYAWNPVTGALSIATAVDTNGGWGLSSLTGLIAQLSPDGNTINGDSSKGEYASTRVVAPSTIFSTILRADFNGDGNSDILWRNGDGSAAIWLMNGLSVLNGGGLLGPGTGWSAKQTGDFNGDGNSDILWENVDGSVAIWLMNGLSVLNGGGLLGPGTGWSVKAIGDFNGDGKSDIVWQHADGSVAIWLMNGLSTVGGGGLLGPGTRWHVTQIGDFNGDGKSDVVWQNVDGSAAIWLMSGVSAIGGGGLIGPGTGWSVTQTGDFNGDGKSDVAWQNIDGSAAVWLMDGVSVIGGGGLIGPGTGWSIRRAADFNGDGKSDVLWQNADGSAAIWLMNGLSVISGGGLIGPGTGWSVKQAGDFNGDTKSDVVWQNVDGSTAIWLLNGLSVNGGGGLLGPGTGWAPAP